MCAHRHACTPYGKMFHSLLCLHTHTYIDIYTHMYLYRKCWGMLEIAHSCKEVFGRDLIGHVEDLDHVKYPDNPQKRRVCKTPPQSKMIDCWEICKS